MVSSRVLAVFTYSKHEHFISGHTLRRYVKSLSNCSFCGSTISFLSVPGRTSLKGSERAMYMSSIKDYFLGVFLEFQSSLVAA